MRDDSAAELGQVSHRAHRFVLFMSLLVVVLWQLPRVWYTRTETKLGRPRFTVIDPVEGWTFTEAPREEALEGILVADRVLNGEFHGLDAGLVRVFYASRSNPDENEQGLFIHTPDRCWTSAGWRLQSSAPDLTQIEIGGIALGFERRVFEAAGQMELVYFAGLIDGHPLPYRLDHNLSSAMKRALTSVNREGTLWSSDARFWARVVQSFLARESLRGQKQFLRVSTPVQGGAVEVGDARLQTFLRAWLRSGGHEEAQISARPAILSR